MEWREKAEELIKIAGEGGDFGGEGLRKSTLMHIRNLARAAEGIAEAAGMDKDKAYALGLMHDIGKYKGIYAINHATNGYEFLMAHDFPEAAKVAMTHTFYNMAADGERLFSEFQTPESEMFAREYLAGVELDDYDRLVQLADNMGAIWGITTINERFCDVLTRHKLPDPQANLLTLYELKQYFEKKAGRNLYSLFKEEIIHGIIEE